MACREKTCYFFNQGPHGQSTFTQGDQHVFVHKRVFDEILDTMTRLAARPEPQASYRNWETELDDDEDAGENGASNASEEEETL